MTHFLRELAASRKNHRHTGIASICSAHPLVIRAVLRRGKRLGTLVLVEATCNQVNQFGGYTGMTPADFTKFVRAIAVEEGFAEDRLILGGDHLGPNPWRKEPAESAMAKAEAMIVAFVKAGFTKLHLDTSMGCAGETAALDDLATAQRAARLALAAERTAQDEGLALPVYIIGTEVPVPGGADHVLSNIEPTRPEAARKTIAVHRHVFGEQGLDDAFHRVIALVVQPGVEFGSENVIAYEPDKAKALCAVLDDEPCLVFEAHSTDFQTKDALRQLVTDGFAILKVGPGVTFALREALYGLDMIASEMDPAYPTRALYHTMEALMTDDPQHWQGHYHGDHTALRLQRHYSYSDRIRYYWTAPKAVAAVDHLLNTLHDQTIPEPVLMQFLPQLGQVPHDQRNAHALLIAAVDRVLDIYELGAGALLQRSGVC